MSRKYSFAALALVAVFIGGWAFAQQGQPAAPKPGAEVPGRFAVTTTVIGAIMVDSATGETWLLREGVESPNGVPPAWEPVNRLKKEEAEKWKEMVWKRKQERVRVDKK